MQKTYYYLTILLAVFLLSCGTKQEKLTSAAPGISSTAIPVVTETVQTTTTASGLSVSGNVEGNKTVRLGFLVAGRINYIAAQEGQMVKRGQVVATLDPASYSIAKQTADVQVQQVTDEYQRLKIMHDRGSISESDFAKVGFALQQAKNQQKLQAQNLAYTKVTTSISGVLLKRLAEPGEITPVGNPVLVISDISSVNVNAYVPENELRHIKLGQTADVQISALDTTYQGKVTEVGAAADPTSRAFTVKIDVRNPRLLIRPGMIAEVNLASNQSSTALTVPAEAVLRDTEGKSYVYVVNKNQSKAYKRVITLGQLMNNRIQVSSGLSAGEVIVTGGQQKLTEGASISISK